MNEYDRQLAAQREEEFQHQAATLIQRRWRQHASEQAPVDKRASETFAFDLTLENYSLDRNDSGAEAAPPLPPEVAEVDPEEMREQLIDRCRQLLADRDTMLNASLSQQSLLTKFFLEHRAAKSGAEVVDKAQEVEADQAFWLKLKWLNAEREELLKEVQKAQAAMSLFRERHEAVLSEAEQSDANFRSFVKETAAQGIFTLSKRGIPPEVMADFEASEDAMYARVHEARVQYINLKNKSKRLLREVNDKDRKRDGMHLIDFEQLKIENTNLNEKIEERNEDLLKLRKKATTTIHVLTHAKEKLEFVKLENAQLQRQVADVEAQLAALRDQLAQGKRQRDMYANDTVRMKERTPLVGNNDLLMDYELRKKAIDARRSEVLEMTNKHHELIRWIKSQQPFLEAMKKTVSL